MKIVPNSKPGDKRTGELTCNVREIIAVLGFVSNVEDDDSKVKYSWGFDIVDGLGNREACGIWDYQESYKTNVFYTSGPHHQFIALFGDKYQPVTRP